MLHVIEWPVVFILLCDLDQHGGMPKQYEKLLILRVFLPIWSIFSKLWVGPGADHTEFC